MPDSIPDEDLENDNEDKKVIYLKIIYQFKEIFECTELAIHFYFKKRLCDFFLIQMFRFLQKSINALIRRSTAKSSVGSVEDDDEGTADAVDVDEVFGDSKPEGGMQEVLKEILDEEDEGGNFLSKIMYSMLQ